MPAPPAVSQGPKTSGLAVTGMVLGIVGVPLFFLPLISILAVIFGIVGAVHTKNGTRKGQGMAIAGIVLGAFVIIVEIIVIGAIPWDDF